jgi:hypothetical protein
MQPYLTELVADMMTCAGAWRPLLRKEAQHELFVESGLVCLCPQALQKEDLCSHQQMIEDALLPLKNHPELHAPLA